jgi:pyruvate kinase
MEKKAKIIATLGPAIYSNAKLRQLVNLGVDAFRINFSHNTQGINKIVSRIRKIEKTAGKKLSLIADLQGVKLRVGNIIGNSQRIKYNQKYIFDAKKIVGDLSRINFPYPKILKKLKKGNKILIDDGKFTFVVTGKKGLAVSTICKSQNCFMKTNKSVHIPNFDISFNKLTSKDKKDIKTAIKLGCNWIAISYLQNEKLILEARKLIKKDMGIISKIENKHALKNIIKIIKATDSIMIARGDLAIDIGHSEVPKVQLSLIKKCSQFSKSVIVATQMLESMIENNTATRAEINDIATAIFQGADTVMLSAEAAIGKFPTQAVSTMTQTILSTEKYKRQHIEDFKNSIISNKDPVKSILLSVKDIAYNTNVKAIIVFSNSGKSAKLVSAMRPAAKIVTISPNINVSRQGLLTLGSSIN